METGKNVKPQKDNHVCRHACCHVCWEGFQPIFSGSESVVEDIADSLEKGVYIIGDDMDKEEKHNVSGERAYIEGYNRGYNDAREHAGAVRTGKWITHYDDLFPEETTIECSCCGESQRVGNDDNFCPYCGSRNYYEED